MSKFIVDILTRRRQGRAKPKVVRLRAEFQDIASVPEWANKQAIKLCTNERTAELLAVKADYR